jgi:hypothetical protein
MTESKWVDPTADLHPCPSVIRNAARIAKRLGFPSFYVHEISDIKVEIHAMDTLDVATIDLVQDNTCIIGDVLYYLNNVSQIPHPVIPQ